MPVFNRSGAYHTCRPEGTNEGNRGIGLYFHGIREIVLKKVNPVSKRFPNER